MSVGECEIHACGFVVCLLLLSGCECSCLPLFDCVCVCVHCAGPTQCSLCVSLSAYKPNMDFASALFGCRFGSVVVALVPDETIFYVKPLFCDAALCKIKSHILV